MRFARKRPDRQPEHYVVCRALRSARDEKAQKERITCGQGRGRHVPSLRRHAPVSCSRIQGVSSDEIRGSTGGNKVTAVGMEGGK